MAHEGRVAYVVNAADAYGIHHGGGEPLCFFKKFSCFSMKWPNKGFDRVKGLIGPAFEPNNQRLVLFFDDDGADNLVNLSFCL